MPILSKTSYLIFIVSNFWGTVHQLIVGFSYVFLLTRQLCAAWICPTAENAELIQGIDPAIGNHVKGQVHCFRKSGLAQHIHFMILDGVFADK